MDDNQQCFLMKHDDGTIFGPITLKQLHQWALDAMISPLDKVSTDGTTWSKAPMLHELEMDYLIEVSADQYYGPTTIGAVKEFLKLREINEETLITNCKDGTSNPVANIPFLQLPDEEEIPEQPVRTSIRMSLQQRIRDLEEGLMEERRAREAAELQCERLEAKVAELSSKTY
ncbi:MAG: hypothetical protein WCH43_14145 [Verrucomicrobiota bacterium]